MHEIVSTLLEETKRNGGKIPYEFISELAEMSAPSHFHLTPNMRVCVLRLPTGHEVIGVAQVLDSANDVESIGKEVAFENAKNELWKLCGTIVLALK